MAAIKPRLIVIALLLAGVAAAAAQAAEAPVVRKNAADQAAARAALVTRADLGTAWRGNIRAVDKPEPLSCPGFAPKQSDLVVTGAAESEWERSGLAISSQAQVLQSASMVRKDWARTIRPALVKCLISSFESTPGGGASLKVVSAQRIAFPAVAPMTAAYRVVADVTAEGGAVRVVIDFVLLAKRRSEATLSFIAPDAAKQALVVEERRLARVVAGRMRA